jgi:hypothetical protein
MKIAYPIPETWYTHDIEPSLRVLEGYLEGVEEQIVHSIKEFDKGKKSYVQVDIPEEGLYDEIEVFRGLDSATFDLTGLFETYFPNLQRRGALMTLYTFLEHELARLCGYFQVELKTKLVLSDLGGKGIIDRSILYLQKVAGLEIDKGNELWGEISNIRHLRNLIAHNDGRLKRLDANDSMIQYIESRADLENVYGDIKIEPDYLKHVLSKFNDFFTELDKLIQGA